MLSQMKTSLLSSARPALLKFPVFSAASRVCIRCFQSRIKSRPVPPPTPFVPDVATLFKLIGRNSGQHASKFPSWEALFNLSTAEVKELGVEPAEARRYIYRWRERFRQGVYGIGGDCKHVENGRAELQIVEVPITATPLTPRGELVTAIKSRGMRNIVVNVPPGTLEPAEPVAQLQPVDKVALNLDSGTLAIRGKNVYPLPSSIGYTHRAVLEVKEGLWEEKLGKKIDGGERRQAEVRSKRRAEERKKEREAAGGA
jgi:hypothetical protein